MVVGQWSWNGQPQNVLLLQVCSEKIIDWNSDFIEENLRENYNKAIRHLFDEINNHSYDLADIIDNYTLDFISSKGRVITVLFDEFIPNDQDENYLNNNFKLTNQTIKGLFQKVNL